MGKSWRLGKTPGFEDCDTAANALVKRFGQLTTLRPESRSDEPNLSPNNYVSDCSDDLSEPDHNLTSMVSRDTAVLADCSLNGSVSEEYQNNSNNLYRRMLERNQELVREQEILELIVHNTHYVGEVRALVKRLMDTFGDLSGVVGASKHQLLKVHGCTEDIYLQLRLCAAFAQNMAKSKIVEHDILDSWNSLILYCRTTMAHLKTEQFRILFLDPKNILISDEMQASGTFDHVPVYPREVAKRALELDASSIILIHNHPSGDTEPSQADIEMTGFVVQTCEIVGISVLDHIIISRSSETSFRTIGLL